MKNLQLLPKFPPQTKKNINVINLKLELQKKLKLHFTILLRY